MHRTRILVGAWVVMLATPVWTMAQPADLDPPAKSGSLVLNGRNIDFAELGTVVSDPGNYDWWYGCSPTSAGMMMCQYDRNGFDNLIPGGLAETNSYGGGGGLDFDLDPTPDLLCNKAIASAGHIADFWVGYGQSGNDPLASGRAIPGEFDCLADFMGTSQDNTDPNYTNSDGGTTFFNFTDGSPIYTTDLEFYGIDEYSGMYGIYEYINYAGYEVEDIYNQYVDALGKTYGFTLAQYMAEIDAGRPVLIHIEGHTMLGYGYDDGDPNNINVYDTWNPNGMNPGTMTWGGYYGAALHRSVTVLEIVPEPTTLGLLAMGLLAVTRRRRRSA